MRDSQDGHLVAVPQLNKRALLHPCPEAAYATPPHAAVASPESSAVTFVPCKHCMSTWEVRAREGPSACDESGRGAEFLKVLLSPDGSVANSGQCGSERVISEAGSSDESEVVVASRSGTCKRDSEWVCPEDA